MKLKRTCLEGWYHAFKWLYNSYEKNSWRVFKIRIKMWKQLVKKKHFWIAPEGRAKQLSDAFKAIESLRTNSVKEGNVAIDEGYYKHPELQQAMYKLSDIMGLAEDIHDNCVDVKITDETIEMIQRLELVVNDVKILIKNWNVK